MPTSRSTFTSWLKEQEHRTDATGQLAQFWRDHTPGRISAVAGVQKHLTMLKDSPAGDPQTRANADHALTLLDGAVREYEAAREGRPPLAAVPDAAPGWSSGDPVGPVVIEGAEADAILADPARRAGLGLPPASAGRQYLADGTYIDADATPWQHVINSLNAHPAGQCEACMPAVRAVVPEPAQEGLWPAERAGDGTVHGQVSITWQDGQTAASGGPSPVRDAVSRATAAGVRAAQAHAVSNAQHERDPHPFDVALARIESKLDRVLAVLGLDDESMAANIRAEIDPDMAADLEDATRPDGFPITDAWLREIALAMKSMDPVQSQGYLDATHCPACDGNFGRCGHCPAWLLPMTPEQARQRDQDEHERHMAWFRYAGNPANGIAPGAAFGNPPDGWQPDVPQADDFARLYELADFGEDEPPREADFYPGYSGDMAT